MRTEGHDLITRLSGYRWNADAGSGIRARIGVLTAVRLLRIG